ncbi:MAG: tail fiber protein, partial [bacterium]
MGTLTATTLNGFGTTPLGGIIMWSGSVDAVPAGWALCDGRSSNGRTTPDLRGRFVIGATSGRVVGSVGGSETVTLTTSQLP